MGRPLKNLDDLHLRGHLDILAEGKQQLFSSFVFDDFMIWFSFMPISHFLCAF